MTLNVYRTTGFISRSVLSAELVREIDHADYPEDPQAFADEHGGDILEPASLDPEEEEETNG
jgi:hypothetical protein